MWPNVVKVFLIDSQSLISTHFSLDFIFAQGHENTNFKEIVFANYEKNERKKEIQ